LSPVIEVEDVWFSYSEEVTALRGVSMEVEEGEMIAIIGQNGGGKTTLAKHLNGLLKPTRGVVRVKKLDTRETPLERLTSIVGYVFQNPAHQIFTSKVYDEVAYGPTNQGLSKEEVDERVEKALEMVGLSEYRDVHPYDLDYGRMKLLTIASILSMEPEVLVLDEPTSGQDHRGVRAVARLISRLGRAGKTILFITHSMRFVAELAERTIVMADGLIIGDGPTREVLTDLEMLKRAAIKPPQIAELCIELKGKGFNLEALTIEEAVKTFSRYLQFKARPR
jgi:energy-coupling factor transport system ATP-binding protein